MYGFSLVVLYASIAFNIPLARVTVIRHCRIDTVFVYEGFVEDLTSPIKRNA